MPGGVSVILPYVGAPCFGAGAVRWKFERALLILEFKDTKLPAPPPLNLIWLLLVVIPLRIYNRCAGIVRADVRGYKLIPKQEEVQKIQRKEQGFIRSAPAASNALEAHEPFTAPIAFHSARAVHSAQALASLPLESSASLQSIPPNGLTRSR